MIALHYALDPNFIVEDVADSTAAEDSADLDPATAYNLLKPKIMLDIQNAIKQNAGDFLNKCKSVGDSIGASVGGSASVGGTAPAGTFGAANGQGAPPAYQAPSSGGSGGSGSLPPVIGRQEDTSKPKPTPQPGSASIPMLGPGGTPPIVGPGGTQRCPQSRGCNSCRGGGCARCCPRNNTDYSSTWQYMVLPSNGGGKCAGDQPGKKKAPSLIWGE